MNTEPHELPVLRGTLRNRLLISFHGRQADGYDWIGSALVRYLGEPDAINVAVLKEYAATFDFRDMSVDEALRLYVSGFRLPGESRCCAAFPLTRPGVRLPVARRAAVSAAEGCHSLTRGLRHRPAALT